MVQAIHGGPTPTARAKPLPAANRQIEGLSARAILRSDQQPGPEGETGRIAGQRPRVRVEGDLAEFGSHYPMMTYCQMPVRTGRYGCSHLAA